MCERYAPRKPKGCSEDDAIEVRDKKAANFCDYFKPSRALRSAEQQAEQAAARSSTRFSRSRSPQAFLDDIRAAADRLGDGSPGRISHVRQAQAVAAAALLVGEQLAVAADYYVEITNEPATRSCTCT